MRFMMIVKASKESEGGAIPTAQELDDMGRYNEELVKAGVMLAGEGLLDSGKGARIKYEGSKRTVIDGPFAEAKELVAGFWVIQVKSRDEALEWAKRVPFQEGEVEIRQVAEAEDFGENFTAEARAQEERLREQIQTQKAAGGKA